MNCFQKFRHVRPCSPSTCCTLMRTHTFSQRRVRASCAWHATNASWCVACDECFSESSLRWRAMGQSKSSTREQAQCAQNRDDICVAVVEGVPNAQHRACLVLVHEALPLRAVAVGRQASAVLLPYPPLEHAPLGLDGVRRESPRVRDLALRMVHDLVG